MHRHKVRYADILSTFQSVSRAISFNRNCSNAQTCKRQKEVQKSTIEASIRIISSLFFCFTSQIYKLFFKFASEKNRKINI